MTARAAPASQTVVAQRRLRELIVGGSLAAGERLTELAMVERLSVSRTPIRAALAKLAEEGLLQPLPGGGWGVRAFDEHDVADAIELRGTLEGLAARLAAERGVAAGLLQALHGCLGAIDTVLARARFTEASFAVYAEHNARFHALVAEASGSAVVQREVQRVVTLPFASPNGFVLPGAGGDRARQAARERLLLAHEQHRAVVEALTRREGARAQALMEEHARNARRNLADVLLNQQALRRVPGAAMIRRARQPEPILPPSPTPRARRP
jgi:GntR family transcriptional regulator, vanillate catabolism transcriptional regulator